nr:hypothetical protein CFP56_27924 [Quercus suber]
MKKLDTMTEMKAVAKICAQWKYAKVLNVGDALRSTLIKDTRTKLNKASRLIMGKRIVTVSTRKELKSLILLREEYGWTRKVKIIAPENKDRIVGSANRNGINLVD